MPAWWHGRLTVGGHQGRPCPGCYGPWCAVCERNMAEASICQGGTVQHTDELMDRLQPALSGSAVHPPPPLLCRAYPVLHPLRIGMHMHQHPQLQVSSQNSYSSSSSTHKLLSNGPSDHCYPRPLTSALPLHPYFNLPLPLLSYYTTTSLSPGPPTNCHYVYCPTVNSKYMAPPSTAPPHLPLPLILLTACHRWTTTISLPLSRPPPMPAAHHQPAEHPVPIVPTCPARRHPPTNNYSDMAPAPSHQTALQQPQRPADNTKERQVSAVLRASSGYRGSDTALLVLTS